MTDTTLGPTGGQGGQEFSNYTVPAGASLREVHIFAGLYVDAVQFTYVDDNDVLVLMPKIGGHGFPSASHHVVKLEAGEAIIGVSGRHGHYVDSIRIQTNKRVTESFGGFSGEHEFRFTAPENSEIVGFFGRADWFIDALGVIVRERAAVAKAPVVEAPAAATTVVAVATAPAETPAAKPAKAKAPAKTPPAAETPAAPAAKAAKAKTPAKTPPAAEVPAAPAAKPAKAPAKTPPAADAPVANAPTRSAPAVELAATTPAVDELLKVEGIGPKIEALLIENGIVDLKTLAATPVQRLREILNGAGARYRIADPTTWPQQAALGAKGDWAGMEALQVQLRAGRPKA